MKEEEIIRLKALISAIHRVTVKIEDLKVERNLLIEEFKKIQSQHHMLIVS
jgi:hypothetical protein